MTEAKQADSHFVMGTRQTVVSLFLVVTLTGIFCGLAYVAGRAVTPIQVQHTAIPAPVVAAEPATMPGPETAPAPAPMAGAPASAPSRAVPAAPASYFQQPETGQTFLQVAAADPGVAVVFAEYLTRLDFSCLIADGPDERSYRVLVGPLADNDAISTTRAALEVAGFQPFVRTYR